MAEVESPIGGLAMRPTQLPAVVATCLLASPLAFAVPDPKPKIASVEVDLVGGSLTIAGSGFGDPTPFVELDAIPLTVLSYVAETMVIAQLPPGVSEGTYDVTLTDTQGVADQDTVTIGAPGSEKGVVITSTEVDEPGERIFILGSGFPGAADAPPLVTVGEFPVGVERFGPDLITAFLPSVPPGTYRLAVDSDGKVGEFDMTIGAEGPVGPQGVQGEPGAQGLSGLQGPVGPQGPEGESGEDATHSVPGGNTFVGEDALPNPGAGANTAIGNLALLNNASGGLNTATGWRALEGNTEGLQNTATGVFALANNLVGSENTAIGGAALSQNTTGDNNTAVGSQALASFSGDGNTALGSLAGALLQSGSDNIFVNNRGQATDNGTIRIGREGTQTQTFIAGIAGTSLTGSPVVVDGSGQLGTGTIDFATNADFATDASHAATADDAANAATADFAITAGTADMATTATSAVTAGNADLLDGMDSNSFLTAVTASSPLVSSGGATPNISLPGVTIAGGRFGESNAVGNGALGSNTGGIRNTAVGNGALGVNNANHNTAMGTKALQNATGGENTSIGAFALSSQTNGGGNTAIGYAANVPVGSSITNSTAIGYQALVDASNKIRLGNGGVTLVETAGDLRIGAGGVNGCIQDGNANAIIGTCVSDVRLKTQITPFPSLLERLVSLEPVHFLWRAEEHRELQLGSEPSYGLIAQDVERLFPEMVDDGPQGYKVVRYSQLPLMLLKAVKEQQEVIDLQRAENDDLRARVEQLEHLIGAASVVAGEPQTLARLERSARR